MNGTGLWRGRGRSVTAVVTGGDELPADDA